MTDKKTTAKTAAPAKSAKPKKTGITVVANTDIFEGGTYHAKGEEFNVSASRAKALGGSVSVAE